MHVRKHIQCSTLFSSKNKCFPLKVVKVNYRGKKSWLSPALKISIKTKKKVYKTFIKTFTNSIANKNIKRLLHVRKHIQCSTLFSSKNICFPLKVVKVNYRAKKSWLSPALQISIKTKKKYTKHLLKHLPTALQTKILNLY